MRYGTLMTMLAALSLAACDNQKAENKFDRAGEAAKDAAKKTGEAAENAAKGVGEAVEGAADTAANRMERAGDTVKKKADTAAALESAKGVLRTEVGRQTGVRHTPSLTFVPDAVPGAPYVVLEYCDRMDLAYAAADLVVARSGANTVCELTAVGLPALYVPLPVGNGEQRLNAAAVVAAGGGLLVDDAAVTPAWVGDVVRPLALDQSRLAGMATAAASVGERGGDELLADLVSAAALGGRP